MTRLRTFFYYVHLFRKLVLILQYMPTTYFCSLLCGLFFLFCFFNVAVKIERSCVWGLLRACLHDGEAWDTRACFTDVTLSYAGGFHYLTVFDVKMKKERVCPFSIHAVRLCFFPSPFSSSPFFFKSEVKSFYSITERYNVCFSVVSLIFAFKSVFFFVLVFLSTYLRHLF